jgi:hypothetical protein
MRHRGVVAALAVLVGVAAADEAPAVRGVAPSAWHLYAGTHFACRDGRSTLPRARVNDDFCDCADGSDEPGTSACATGTFYCANKGFRGKSIPSSHVGDSVCDWCVCRRASAAPDGVRARSGSWRSRPAARPARPALQLRRLGRVVAHRRLVPLCKHL